MEETFESVPASLPNLAGLNRDHDIMDPTLQRRDDLGVHLLLSAHHMWGYPFSAS